MSLLGGFKKLLGDAGHAVDSAIHPQQQIQQRQPVPLTQNRQGLTFAASNQPQYEDDALVNGPQGLVPGNNDVGRLAMGGETNLQPSYNSTNGDDNPNAVMGSHYFQPTYRNPQMNNVGALGSLQGGGQTTPDTSYAGGSDAQASYGGLTPLQQLLRRR